MPSPSIPVIASAPVASHPVVGVLPVALRRVLILILAIAPLPLASARPLAWSVLALAVGALLLLATLCELIERTPSVATAPLRVPAGLAVLIAIWILVQSLPLPSAGQYSPLWETAAQAMGAAVQPSISLDREASISHLLRLLTYAAVFLVAWRVARNSESAGSVVRAVGMIGIAYALYGLLVYFSGNHTVLWFTKWAYRQDLTGTFVNRSSFATFIGLCLLANFAWLAQVLASRVGSRGWRAHLESVIECLLQHGRWQTLGLVIIASALLFTHSRGGTVSALLGVAALAASAAIAPSLRGPWRMSLVTLAVAGAVLIVALNGGSLLSRVADTSVEKDLRFDINAGTLSAIGDSQPFGTGLGTFKYVYAPYQTPSLGALVDVAHDDYLENVLELGVPAGIAFYAVLFLLVLECFKGVFRRRRDAIYACMGIGVSVLVGCHSAVDFSMQMPAVAITFAALLGVGVAQSVRMGGRANRGGTPPKTA